MQARIALGLKLEDWERGKGRDSKNPTLSALSGIRAADILCCCRNSPEVLQQKERLTCGEGLPHVRNKSASAQHHTFKSDGRKPRGLGARRSQLNPHRLQWDSWRRVREECQLV